MTATAALTVEPLNRQHDRRAFSCGVASLDDYLARQASQDVRRRTAAVFVMIEPVEPKRVLGYFTLSSYALDRRSIPAAVLPLMPRYPMVGATIIGRLAVDSSRQGRGYGSALLARALRLVVENTAVVGSSMVIVDALDERAAAFYRSHGFIPLAESRRLILPLASVVDLAGP